MDGSSIDSLVSAVRDHVNEPRIRDVLLAARPVWNGLTSSLDVLEDADAAMSAYEKRPEQSDKGDQYLATYGVLQALVLQQDALTHLTEALAWPISIKDYTRLEQVLELRNISIGHPTRKERRRGGRPASSHFIAQISLSKRGFEVMSVYDDGQTEFTPVNVLALIADQRALVAQILSELVSELRRRDEEHKAPFRSDPLVGVFPDTLGYAIEKIGDEVRGDRPGVGRWGISHLREALTRFEEALATRGLALNTYDAIGDTYEQIGFALDALAAYLDGDRDGEIRSPRAASLFLAHMVEQLRRLRALASEIDDDYDASPSSELMSGA